MPFQFKFPGGTYFPPPFSYFPLPFSNLNFPPFSKGGQGQQCPVRNLHGHSVKKSYKIGASERFFFLTIQ